MLAKDKGVVRVAVSGYGLAGSVFHAPLLKAVDGIEVAAIVSRSAEKQKNAKNDFPDAEIYADLDSLLENCKGLDLVVIATPNTDHAPSAIKAMEKGLSVVVDKPMATRLQDCLAMLESSRKNGVLLSVFHNRRWDGDFLTIRELIENGRLGRILRFESRFERYRPSPRAGSWREASSADQGGGILFDLGSHLIDQASQLFGHPEQIYSEICKRRDAIESDDDSFLALSFPGEIKAHLWMSAISASQGHRFRILGTEGAYEKYGLDPQEDMLRQGKTPLDSNWGLEDENAWGILTTYENGAKEQLALKTNAGCYQRFYELMRDALNGNGSVPVDPEDSLETLRIIQQAARTNNSKVFSG